MKHRITHHRWTSRHALFMLGVARSCSNGWSLRCDGDTDPLRYWERWTCRKIHVGFYTFTVTRTERFCETAYHEFHPAFPPLGAFPPARCTCDQKDIVTGKYCNRCWRGYPTK